MFIHGGGNHLFVQSVRRIKVFNPQFSLVWQHFSSWQEGKLLRSWKFTMMSLKPVTKLCWLRKIFSAFSSSSSPCYLSTTTRLLYYCVWNILSVVTTTDGSSLCSYKTCQEASDLSKKSGKPYLCSHGQLAKESESSSPELVVSKEAFRYMFCVLSFHFSQCHTY